MDQRWRLISGDVLVGVIEVSDSDFPWLSGRFEPTAAFVDYRDAFAKELELVEGDLQHKIDEWESAYRVISDQLRLVRPDGTSVPEYLLHIRETEAWFRYSDVPFEKGDALAPQKKG
jgi:hypothetical protein